MKIGFLSDAHGNYHAFLKAISVFQEEDISEIYFLGDAIGYFDSPEVVFYLQQHKIISLRGNHEDMVINKAVPEEKEKFYRLKKHYNSSIVSIISSWNESVLVTINEKRIYMVHGSVEEPVWGYTYDDAKINVKQDYDLVVCGATHRPFIKKIDDKILANIGSCGFPRDIGSKGSCGVYDAINHDFKIIRFDISDSIGELRLTHEGLDKAIYAVWERN